MRAQADRGDRTTPIRPASTVLLVRDSDSGVEVFALRRVAAMAFAGGMTAFPGGAVDAGDEIADTRWAGPPASWWADRLGVAEQAARSLVVAAVRELFEETGVQLVAPRPALSEDDRLEVLGRRRTLDRALAAAGCSLDSGLLRPWANWVTPPGRTRRYDTFFFLAALPDGQQAQLLTTEADAGQWYRPASLLAAGTAGTVGIMPPTAAMLTDLATAATTADLLGATRAVTRVTFDDPRRERSDTR